MLCGGRDVNLRQGVVEGVTVGVRLERFSKRGAKTRPIGKEEISLCILVLP